MARESNKLLFLKTRFTSEVKGIYGVFFIMLDPNTNNYQKFDLLASHFSEFLKDLPDKNNWDSCPWAMLEEVIKKARYNNKYTVSITKDLSRTMEKTLNTAEIEMILPMVTKKEVANLDKFFHEVFRKAIGDIAVDFTFAFEETSLKEVMEKEDEKKEVYEMEQQEIKDQVEEFEASKHQLPANSALFDVSFVLSPVKGIPIADLKPGHHIFIKIDLNNTKGKYFAELLGATTDGDIKPIPAVVEKVGKGPTGEYFVITKIQDGVYGRISELEPVKIRLFDPVKDKDLLLTPVEVQDKKEILSEIDVSDRMDSKSKISLIIIAAIILTAMMIVIYYYVL